MGTWARLGVGATGAAVALQILAPTVGAQVVSGGQEVTITNAGEADASSGTNGGTGNGSGNSASADQSNLVPADLETNNATSGNASGGTATIGTGNADATGNRARNSASQTAIPGEGVVLFDQVANLTNGGTADSETGLNNAIGNESSNTATVTQSGDINFANATNSSDGSVNITTGNACAVGNLSSNEIVQALGAEARTVSSNDLPSDPCEKKAPPAPPTDDKPGAPKDGGEALARTGADLSELALAGAGITAIGGYLRRRGRKSA